MYYNKTYVKYQVYSGKTVVKGYETYQPCYSHLTLGVFDGVIDKIDIFCKKEWSPFTKAEIVKSVKLFCKTGFNVSFKEVNDEYKFTVLFENTPEQQNRLYITAILFMIRYIWHDGLTKIHKEFLTFTEIKDADPFMSMQLAHNYGKSDYGNTNHMLFSPMKGTSFKPISFEKFLDAASKGLTFKTYSGGLSTSWEKILEKTDIEPDRKNYKKYYNKLTSNNE